MLNKRSFIMALFPPGEDNELISNAVDAQLESGDDNSAFRQRFMWQLERSTDVTSIARIVVAVTALDPHNSWSWLESLRRYFEGRSDWRSKVTRQFVLGIILGIFRSQVWLDTHWRTLTGFEEHLPETICDIVFAQSISGESNPEFQLITWDSPYESNLSAAVKQYMRPDKEFPERRPPSQFVGRRLADGHQLLSRLAARYDVEPHPEVSLLGQMVANQLAYAQFGYLSVIGRVQALAALDRQLFPGLKAGDQTKEA